MLNGLLHSSVRLLSRETYARWLVRLLGLALFVVLLTQFDLGEVARLGASIRWPAWLAAFALNAAILLASSLRWHGMVTTLPQASGFTFSAALSQFLRYYAIGLASPARAAELTRAWALSRITGLGLGAAAAVVLLERAIDITASLVMSIAALAVLPVPWLRSLFWLSIAGVTALVLALLLGRRGFGLLLAWFLTRLQQSWSPSGTGRIGMQVAAMLATWRRFNGLALLRPIAWTVVTDLCYLGLCMALGLGLALPVPPLALALAAALASVIATFPVTVAGLGAREALLILLLAPYGVTPESAIAYSLALLVVFYGGGILPGAVLWLLHAEARSVMSPQASSSSTLRDQKP